MSHNAGKSLSRSPTAISIHDDRNMKSALPHKVWREIFLGLAHGANQGFHVGQVIVERRTAFRSEPVFRSRQPSFELLFTIDVARFFQPARMNAEVSVSCSKNFLELPERQAVVYRKCAHNAQA